MQKAKDYIKHKILDQEKYLKQYINNEKKHVKEFYNRYMGLYNSDVGYKLIFDTSDDLLLELLETEFQDINFEEYECSKYLIKILNEKLSSFSKERYEGLNNAVNILNCYVQHIDNRMDKLIDQYEYKCKIYSDSNKVFGEYINGLIVIKLLPIYFFSIRYSLKTELFALSTFAHELAHFYNHLGKDKDELQWLDFYDVEKRLIEGLAQYYAKEYMKQKGFFKEFEKENNLVDQEGLFLFDRIYHEYRKYDKFTREQVSNALLFSRRNNVRSADHFLEILEKISKELPC